MRCRNDSGARRSDLISRHVPSSPEARPGRLARASAYDASAATMAPAKIARAGSPYVLELHRKGRHTVVELADPFNVSRTTVYRVIDRARAKARAMPPAI